MSKELRDKIIERLKKLDGTTSSVPKRLAFQQCMNIVREEFEKAGEDKQSTDIFLV